MLPPLWLILFLLLGVSVALGRTGMILTAAILTVTWLAGWSIYYMTGNDYIWQTKAAVDIAACTLLLIGTCCKPQLVIAGLYIAMLLTHAWFSWAGETDVTRYYYWYNLYYLATAQALVLLLWAGYDGVRLVRGFDLADDRLWPWARPVAKAGGGRA